MAKESLHMTMSGRVCAANSNSVRLPASQRKKLLDRVETANAGWCSGEIGCKNRLRFSHCQVEHLLRDKTDRSYICIPEPRRQP